LVLADVAAVLGPEAVTVGSADEFAAATGWPSPAFRPHYVAYVPGEMGGTGLTDHGGPWLDLLVKVAEDIQEVVIESRRHFGIAFPACPEHPNHPMWPEIRGDQAVWECQQGGDAFTPLGSLTG
jgi:hypothetical protein